MDAAAAFSLTDLFIIIGTAMLFAKNSNEPPKVPYVIPFVGSILSFGPGPVQFLRECRKKYGDVFTAHILGKDMTFLCHPKEYNTFFNSTDSELSLRDVYRFMTPVFGKGVVYDAASTEVMMEQLKFVTSRLTTASFVQYVNIFEQEVASKASKLDKLFGNEKSIKIPAFQNLADLIIFTASRCLLGDGVREYLEDKDMGTLYHQIDEGISPISFFFPNLPLPSMRSRNSAREAVTKIFQELIDKRRKAAATEEFNDVLQSLIEGKYRSGEQLSDEHIKGILLAGLFAGQHTSSITITWTLLSIVNNPEVYAKVMAEQEKLCDGDLKAKITYDKVNAMEYLEKCVKEALRMFPPLIMLMRKVKQDRKTTKYTIPAGNIVVVSPSVNGRLEDIFENPDVFNPDRTFEQAGKYAHAQLAFGSGRHKCIGENFAILQVKTVLSCLLRRYKIKLASKFPEINYTSMVVGPEENNYISLEHRTSFSN